MEAHLPTVVCAWCDRLLRRGLPSVSHGICPDCADAFVRSFPAPRPSSALAAAGRPLASPVR